MTSRLDISNRARLVSVCFVVSLAATCVEGSGFSQMGRMRSTCFISTHAQRLLLRGGGACGWHDELEALSAIFGDDMTTQVEDEQMAFRIAVDAPEAQAACREPAIMHVTCSAGYPEELPHISVDVRGMSGSQEQTLVEGLEAEALLLQGQPMIFQLFRSKLLC